MPPSVQMITCDNPSPMTLEGTNSYLIGSPDADQVCVVDPGPQDHPEHVEALLSAAGSRTVAMVVLTHRHRDHQGAAAELARRAGAAVRAFDPRLCLGAEQLHDGERLLAAGVELEVLHTPGHTSDSVCLWLPEAQAMITGDTVLGRGTTMLDFPDGTLTDYLETLQRLEAYPGAMLLPAHGPAGAELSSVVAQYRRHRLERLEQVRALLHEHGPLDAAALGELIYGRQTAVRPEVVRKIAGAQLHHLGLPAD